MKKGLTLVASLVFAFAIVATTAAQDVQTYEYDSAHYQVTSEVSKDYSQAVSERLEALLGLYNTYFHFDLASLPVKLKVQIFSGKDRYDAYLQRVISETRDNYLYLHYGDLQKSELVGYYVAGQDLSPAAIHQSFIQYLRAFIPDPPLWLREGFAVFFEATSYDANFNAASYKENLSWLDSLKQIISGQSTEMPLTLDQLLNIDLSTAKKDIDVFYPEAWGVVSYLVNTDNKSSNRILWDAIGALKPSATLEQNDKAAAEAFTWTPSDKLEADFLTYVDARKSFRGLVEEGMNLYASNDMNKAEEDFIKALNLREDNYVPYYYLGLINYGKRNYQLSDYYYKQALDKGASKALSYYALGVNAYADNRFSDATKYLNQTAQLDTGDLKQKAQDLLKRIQS